MRWIFDNYRSAAATTSCGREPGLYFSGGLLYTTFSLVREGPCDILGVEQSLTVAGLQSHLQSAGGQGVADGGALRCTAATVP